MSKTTRFERLEKFFDRLDGMIEKAGSDRKQALENIKSSQDPTDWSLSLDITTRHDTLLDVKAALYEEMYPKS